jgi:pimeloyl-ACP methyl ester carboxylesterase
VHEDRENDPALRGAVLAMARATGADAFARQQTAIMNRIDSRPYLSAISCPTLVLVGEGDRLTPPERAREMHALVPGSRLEVIPASGHLPTLETPAATTAVLRAFLAG